MGFYIRKSISAGPFRFNLSGRGVGLSVGVKGFRVGAGPRGNYIHMGRGGLYYRASLGGTGRSRRSAPIRNYPVEQPAQPAPGSVVETGDVLAMKPSNGSQIVDQINEKMRLIPFWPWPLVGAGLLAIAVSSQAAAQSIIVGALAVAAALSFFLAIYDRQRKTVVVMYDLDDDAVWPFQKFVEEFDKLRAANRIWNVDSAERTSDWKRNAGAVHLLTRKIARLTYTPPRVVKTNLSVPAIIGGRQNIYFFPDVVLIVEGSHAGALAYDQLEVVWANTVFIESDGVPSDAQVVGHTWRFVNKKGGPDRRFNNNRQIPQCLYLQMGLNSSEGLRKVLQFSKLLDHSGFDEALNALRGLIRKLNVLAVAAPVPEGEGSTSSLPSPESMFTVTEAAKKLEIGKPNFWEYKLTAELLRANVGPILEQSKRLSSQKQRSGLPIPSPKDALDWCQARMDETPRLCQVFTTLVNERLPASWGRPGQPGNAVEIEEVCRRLTECARQVVMWKESVGFAALPTAFADVQTVLSTFPDSLLEQIGRIAVEIARIFGQENPSGTYNIDLVVTAPDHWAEQFNAALKTAAKSLGLSATASNP